MRRLQVAIAIVSCAAACDGSKSDQAAAASTQAEPGPMPSTSAAATAETTAAAGPRPLLIAMGPGAVDALVREHREVSEAPLVVYVGASWCEPCKYFKSALAAGELDAHVPGLQVLEFDWDRDSERLEAAGYGGRMLPRFVAPGADGRGSDRRFEGSVKGPTAVANILPRLTALVAPTEAPTEP